MAAFIIAVFFQLTVNIDQAGIRDVRYTDIPKIPVLKLISVYRYDFFSHTDIPKLSVYRKTSVFRYIGIAEIYRYTGVILTIAYCCWRLSVFR